jgi:uncharacterized membrane-anchored protein YjiN (DUF445 family)
MNTPHVTIAAASARADPRLSTLKRRKRQAFGLLLAAVAGLIWSEAMGGHGGWAWGKAFSEAAAIGALADWFAVVALFRHPLGLPIPHTDVIRQNKARIADTLAVFVRDHFLDQRALLDMLSIFNPAERLGQWLAEPAQVQSWVTAARALGSEAMDWLDDARLQQALRSSITDALLSWNAAQTAGQLLGVLTRDGRHQELLDGALQKLANFLGQDEVKTRVSALMVKYARAEWPHIMSTIDYITSVDTIADNLADRLAQALLSELQDILQHPEHQIRRDYEDTVLEFIDRLCSDPVVGVQIDQIKEQIIQNLEIQRYVEGLVLETKAWIRADLSREDSRLGRHLEQLLSGLGNKLRDDAALREAINAHVLSSAAKLAHKLRDGVTDYIAKTVKAWDDSKLVSEVELSIGEDLQFIRFNGTIVGGLVGLVLHALPTIALPLLQRL